MGNEYQNLIYVSDVRLFGIFTNVDRPTIEIDLLSYYINPV